jgi:hypothetical protein
VWQMRTWSETETFFFPLPLALFYHVPLPRCLHGPQIQPHRRKPAA